MPDGQQNTELQRRIYQAMKALPAREREVFSRFYGGMSPRDIAEELDIDQKSVRAALRQARERLSRWLDGLEIDF